MVEATSREREKIAFGRYIDWEHEGLLGTIFFGPDERSGFPPLPIRNVNELLVSGYLDPESTHNDSPTAEQLVGWASEIQQQYLSYQLEVGLVGYMVSQERSDARLRLTGVSIRSPGPLPESLKAEVGNPFDPDLLQIDDFEVVLRWD